MIRVYIKGVPAQTHANTRDTQHIYHVKITHPTSYTIPYTSKLLNQSASYYLTLYTERYHAHYQSYTLFQPLGFSWNASYLSYLATYSIVKLPSGRTVHTYRLNCNGL